MRCYRPISLLDTSIKILRRIIFKRIRLWATEHNILNSAQYGFCETMEQCLNLYLLVQKYTRLKKVPIYLGFMDLSTAFDSVNRQMLWMMLERKALDPPLIAFLHAVQRYFDKSEIWDVRGGYSVVSCQARGPPRVCACPPLVHFIY